MISKIFVSPRIHLQQIKFMQQSSLNSFFKSKNPSLLPIKESKTNDYIQKQHQDSTESNHFPPIESLTSQMGSYRPIANPHLNSPSFQQLYKFLSKTYTEQPTTTFPPFNQLFSAFDLTPLDSLKVVIMGQDPYHGPNQAHGLCFSVNKGIPVPPSLRNIYKCMKNDFPDFSVPSHGDLRPWAKQGVLMLNTCLSVEQGKPNCHQKKGWEKMVEFILREVCKQKKGVIFLLWGAPAQKVEEWIGKEQVVLKSSHPSPLSAHRGFLECGHFKKVNEILKDQGKTEINWKL